VRRALLVVVLLLAGALTACAGGATRTVSVLAIWTGPEELAFRQVLDRWAERTGVSYSYVGTRAASQVLASDVQQGDPPDVAILSSPSDLARYLPRDPGHAQLGELHPVGDVPGADRQPWLLRDRAQLVTATVKAGRKSVLWYRSATGPHELGWAELTALRPVCLGLQSLSTTGWPGTDWVEDLLLHQFGADVYRSWAAGRLAWTDAKVRQAWQTWGVLAGGGIAPLLTDFHTSVTPGCVVAHQGDDPGNGFVHSAFPTADPGIGSVTEVAADSAGLFTDSAEAAGLVRDLAGQVDVRALESGTRLCYDASDLMPAAMTDAFYRAVLAYQADPGQLDAILTDLDRIRVAQPGDRWLDVPCTSAGSAGSG
jgi:alpha-glucoside transport system substrate-binding protein